MQHTTIETLFTKAARAHPRRAAVDDGVTALTFGEVDRLADDVALRLSRAGAGRDEPVIIAVSNIARDIPAFLGIWRAGAVAVPVHRTTPAALRDTLIARIGARLVLDDGISVMRDSAPEPRPLLAGAGVIVFTSGSTGEPKGVVLSAARAADKLSMIAAMTRWKDETRCYIPLQLTFSFGQWASWLTMTRGGTAHLRARFDPADCIGAMERDIARIAIVPTALRRLCEAGRTTPWSGTFMTGGEVLPAPLGRQALTRFPGAGIGDIYGLSETGTCDFFVQPEGYDSLAGAIGHAGDGIDYRIAPDGELQIRSPWGMLGYLDRSDLTGAAFADGYFRTGDLARRRGDGALELIGRSKDIIVRSGNKIAPMEIEAVFLTHPSVGDALAVGMPDPDRGEALHIALVMKPGQSMTPAALKDWAADRIEKYKFPDAIHFMESLPTGRTGKTDRTALRRLLLEEG